MKYLKRFFSGIILFLLASCSNTPKIPDTNITDFEEIKLERTGCFGICPIYSVTIQKDGVVVYNGTGEVQVEGERRIKISVEDINFLLIAFEKAQFLSLKNSYKTKQDGCKQVWTDSATETISFRSSHQSKTVSYYHGCMGAIDTNKISWLSNTIDFLANTWQWIVFNEEWYKE